MIRARSERPALAHHFSHVGGCGEGAERRRRRRRRSGNKGQCVKLNFDEEKKGFNEETGAGER